MIYVSILVDIGTFPSRSLMVQFSYITFDYASILFI